MAQDRDTRKAYAWEDSWLHWNKPGFKNKIGNARSWVRWACRRYGIPYPVVIRLADKEKTSWSIPTYGRDGKVVAHRIELHPKHNNFAIALHEAAHVIDDYINDPMAPSHNKTWLGIYIDLLVASGVYPKAAIIASAKAAGLKWITPRRKKKKARKPK